MKKTFITTTVLSLVTLSGIAAVPAATYSAPKPVVMASSLIDRQQELVSRSEVRSDLLARTRVYTVTPVAPRPTPKPIPKPKPVVVVVQPKPVYHPYVAPKPVYVAPSVSAGPGGAAACIRKWESGNNYQAQNPSSTASGAYQFLDSTWQGVTGLSGRAMNYSPSIQDAAFYKLWANGAGRSQWTTGYHC